LDELQFLVYNRRFVPYNELARRHFWREIMADKQKEKEEGLVLEGVVSETIKNGFRVKLCPAGTEGQNPDDDAQVVIGHLAGKMRMNNIKVVPGDRVKIELSPYDLTRGRITFRMKG
jgi:translation initiation factor IF-1